MASPPRRVAPQPAAAVNPPRAGVPATIVCRLWKWERRPRCLPPHRRAALRRAAHSPPRGWPNCGTRQQRVDHWPCHRSVPRGAPCLADGSVVGGCARRAGGWHLVGSRRGWLPWSPPPSGPAVVSASARGERVPGVAIPPPRNAREELRGFWPRWVHLPVWAGGCEYEVQLRAVGGDRGHKPARAQPVRDVCV